MVTLVMGREIPTRFMEKNNWKKVWMRVGDSYRNGSPRHALPVADWGGVWALPRDCAVLLLALLDGWLAALRYVCCITFDQGWLIHCLHHLAMSIHTNDLDSGHIEGYAWQSV